jgi:hypothetical protein
LFKRPLLFKPRTDILYSLMEVLTDVV